MKNKFLLADYISIIIYARSANLQVILYIATSANLSKKTKAGK